ncbi:hypothetical protein J4232_06335 [Candidatus Woesearchaeota archaeon]|nr:hypothetical protein [Candidatus Woesearchaeota archaeon]
MDKQVEASDEIRKRIDDYIHTEYQKGFTLDQIQNALLKAGYKEGIVKELLKKYVTTGKALGYNPLLHKSQLIIGLVLLVVIIFFVFYLKSFSAVDCTNEQCFLENANNCNAARYQITVDQIQYEFTTDNDCNVVKKIVKLSDEEPKEIKELIEGKSMTCSYVKNNFNQELLTTLLSGLDKCTGQLKEGLYEIVLAER